MEKLVIEIQKDKKKHEIIKGDKMGLISKLSKDKFIKEFFDAWRHKSSSRLLNIASNVYAEIEAKDKRIAELEARTCENCEYRKTKYNLLKDYCTNVNSFTLGNFIDVNDSCYKFIINSHRTGHSRFKDELEKILKEHNAN